MTVFYAHLSRQVTQEATLVVCGDDEKEAKEVVQRYLQQGEGPPYWRVTNANNITLTIQLHT